MVGSWPAWGVFLAFRVVRESMQKVYDDRRLDFAKTEARKRFIILVDIRRQNEQREAETNVPVLGGKNATHSLLKSTANLPYG